MISEESYDMKKIHERRSEFKQFIDHKTYQQDNNQTSSHSLSSKKSINNQKKHMKAIRSNDVLDHNNHNPSMLQNLILTHEESTIEHKDYINKQHDYSPKSNFEALSNILTPEKSLLNTQYNLNNNMKKSKEVNFSIRKSQDISNRDDEEVLQKFQEYLNNKIKDKLKTNVPVEPSAMQNKDNLHNFKRHNSNSEEKEVINFKIAQIVKTIAKRIDYNKKSKEVKFNNKMKIFNGLSSFIDISSFIKDMSSMNTATTTTLTTEQKQQQLQQQQIQQIQQQQHMQKYLNYNKELEDTLEERSMSSSDDSYNSINVHKAETLIEKSRKYINTKRQCKQYDSNGKSPNQKNKKAIIAVNSDHNPPIIRNENIETNNYEYFITNVNIESVSQKVIQKENEEDTVEKLNIQYNDVENKVPDEKKDGSNIVAHQYGEFNRKVEKITKILRREANRLINRDGFGLSLRQAKTRKFMKEHIGPKKNMTTPDSLSPVKSQSKLSPKMFSSNVIEALNNEILPNKRNSIFIPNNPILIKKSENSSPRKKSPKNLISPQDKSTHTIKSPKIENNELTKNVITLSPKDQNPSLNNLKLNSETKLQLPNENKFENFSTFYDLDTNTKPITMMNSTITLPKYSNIDSYSLERSNLVNNNNETITMTTNANTNAGNYLSKPKKENNKFALPNLRLPNLENMHMYTSGSHPSIDSLGDFLDHNLKGTSKKINPRSMKTSMNKPNDMSNDSALTHKISFPTIPSKSKFHTLETALDLSETKEFLTSAGAYLPPTHPYNIKSPYSSIASTQKLFNGFIQALDDTKSTNDKNKKDLLKQINEIQHVYHKNFGHNLPSIKSLDYLELQKSTLGTGKVQRKRHYNSKMLKVLLGD